MGGMENQLFDCLFANLIGFGKQFLPKGQIAMSGEGQNAFFDILAEKMGGTEGIPLFAMPVDAKTGNEAEVPQEEDAGAADAGQGPVAARLDPGEITVLVSSLLSPQGLSLVVDKEFESKDAGAPDIIGFLRNVLDVLSDGDQIELGSEEGTEAMAALPVEEDGGDDAVEQAKDNGPFMGQLASIIHQLNRIAAQGNEKANAQPQTGAPVPGVETPDLPLEAKKPDPACHVADQLKETRQVIVNEDQEAPAFVVEIVKAAKKAQVREVSSNKELRPQAGVQAPVAEEATDAKDDLLIVPARKDAVDENIKEPKKVVIRVSDAKGAEIGDKEDGGRMVAHHDNSRHAVQNASETKAAAKNGFGAMMVDKIEKMTEQFAGRNMNMDMVVRLKIDEKDTLLVGLKEDGGRVTVELRSANENMMNLLQSQKEDITKNLEAKNIHASIHVDLDQDGSGRHGRKNDSGNRDDEEQDGQDFSSFIEALS